MPEAQSPPADTVTKKPSVVAVVRTKPETVLEDIGRAMELAGYSSAIPKAPETALKINISWQHYYPACSTTRSMVR